MVFSGSASDDFNSVKRIGVIKNLILDRIDLSDEETLRIAKKLDQATGPGFLKAVQKNKDILSCFNLCLKKVKIKLDDIHVALELFSKKINRSKRAQKRKSKGMKITKILAKLKEFELADGDLFAELDSNELKSSNEEILKIVQVLEQKKEEAQNLLSATKRWRKICDLLCTMVFDLVSIIPVLFAVLVGASPVAITAASAGAAVMKSFEPLWNSWWDRKEKVLEGEIEAVEILGKLGSMEMQEMEDIQSLAKRLKADLQAVVSSGLYFQLGEEQEALKIAAIRDMKSRIEEVEDNFKRLKKKVSSLVKERQLQLQQLDSS